MLLSIERHGKWIQISSNIKKLMEYRQSFSVGSDTLANLMTLKRIIQKVLSQRNTTNAAAGSSTAASSNRRNFKFWQ